MANVEKYCEEFNKFSFSSIKMFYKQVNTSPKLVSTWNNLIQEIQKSSVHGFISGVGSNSAAQIISELNRRLNCFEHKLL